MGDGGPDMELGRALGVRAIGVTWGIGTADQLRAWGAEAVIDSIAELPALLGVRAGNLNRRRGR